MKKNFTLEELCTLAGMNKRRVRYYIQQGLVDRPEGTGKGAFYTRRHLEQLLSIARWKEAGLNLERIREITAAGEEPAAGRLPPPRPRKPGAVEVWSHIYLADGVELHLEPERSGLSPEQVRELAARVMATLEQIREEKNEN
jgi:DNA-binding transcriptional MerR regulator